MIEIRHLSHSLGQSTILEDVNLTIPDSTVMGLVGINGAGKTTLLRLMSGVYLPDRGRIFYDGATVSPRTRKRDRTYSSCPTTLTTQ